MRLDREWVLAHVTRCRGLVASARGDIDRAAFLLEQAVAQHEAGRRSVRTGSSAARTRGRPAAGAAEARRPRSDRGCARRLRAARGRDLGREGARRARADRRAHPSGGADCRGAPGRRARRRGPHEPGGRGGALPHRADGREPPDPHLRQARHPLADGARPPADRGAAAQAKFRRSDVSNASPRP